MRIEKLDLNGHELLYKQIADIIERKITSGELGVEDRIPPEEELCLDFKVSRRTMRKAILQLVKEGYLARRRNHGTFVISANPGKETDFKKKNEIGVIFNPEKEKKPHFHKILAGIEEKLREKGLYLVYGTINDSKISLAGKDRDIAGLIITGGITPKIVSAVEKAKIPYVLLGDIFQKERTPLKTDIIANNDFQGTYLATSRLAGLGHRDILFLAAFRDRYSWEIEQLNGYLQALKEAGIKPDPALQVETGRHEINAGYSAVKKIIESGKKFTGMVCLSENLCYGALKALREKDLSVPRDISAVCISVAGLDFIPEMTTVVYDCEEMGHAAVERLIRRVKDRGLKPERIIVPSKLVESKSTIKRREQ